KQEWIRDHEYKFGKEYTLTGQNTRTFDSGYIPTTTKIFGSGYIPTTTKIFDSLILILTEEENEITQYSVRAKLYCMDWEQQWKE
ncbi:13891_t:CDS:2, partial [Acaulospora morrowiae]